MVGAVLTALLVPVGEVRAGATSNAPCCSLAGGEISFLQDAEATLSAIYKRPVQLDPSFVSRKQPVPPRVFMARMLNNLKQVGALPCC